MQSSAPTLKIGASEPTHLSSWTDLQRLVMLVFNSSGIVDASSSTRTLFATVATEALSETARQFGRHVYDVLDFLLYNGKGTDGFICGQEFDSSKPWQSFAWTSQYERCQNPVLNVHYLLDMVSYLIHVKENLCNADSKFGIPLLFDPMCILLKLVETTVCYEHELPSGLSVTSKLTILESLLQYCSQAAKDVTVSIDERLKAVAGFFNLVHAVEFHLSCKDMQTGNQEVRCKSTRFYDQIKKQFNGMSRGIFQSLRNIASVTNAASVTWETVQYSMEIISAMQSFGASPCTSILPSLSPDVESVYINQQIALASKAMASNLIVFLKHRARASTTMTFRYFLVAWFLQQLDSVYVQYHMVHFLDREQWDLANVQSYFNSETTLQLSSLRELHTDGKVAISLENAISKLMSSFGKGKLGLPNRDMMHAQVHIFLEYTSFALDNSNRLRLPSFRWNPRLPEWPSLMLIYMNGACVHFSPHCPQLENPDNVKEICTLRHVVELVYAAIVQQGVHCSHCRLPFAGGKSQQGITIMEMFECSSVKFPTLSELRGETGESLKRPRSQPDTPRRVSKSPRHPQKYTEFNTEPDTDSSVDTESGVNTDADSEDDVSVLQYKHK
jgi:hypothetical protein